MAALAEDPMLPGAGNMDQQNHSVTTYMHDLHLSLRPFAATIDPVPVLAR